MIGVSAWDAGADLPEPVQDLLVQARTAAGNPEATLKLAPAAVEALPMPGGGQTPLLWRGLAELAAVDLTVARTLEPHLDAQAILQQAHERGYAAPSTSGTWGVFAAEGPGLRLDAHDVDGHAVLTGRKPWCSLAQLLDRALITAWVAPDRRGLFAVALSDPGVSLVEEPWVARGLEEVRSTGLDLREVPAVRVGPPGWYFERPGFAWGGMGVAACWLGGAMGLARRLRRLAGDRPPDQIGLALLGAADARLTAAAAVLTEAAAAVDAGLAEGEFAWARCVRARHVVHDACEHLLRLAAHGLGPGPLTGEADHAARVADLEIYLRQHKGDRDAAAVGDAVARGMPTQW